MNADGKIYPSDQMTSRQRLLAAYAGEAIDRLPYWAKVANDTWRTAQPAEVRRWSDRELLDYIGADGIFGCGQGVWRTAPHAPVGTRRDGRVETRVTRTPDGDLVERWSQDPATRSWHPTEFPVKTADDLARLRWLYTDVRYGPDADAIADLRARRDAIGQRGITKTAWGTSPLMHLVEHVIGPVNTHLMLHDRPEAMDEIIERMHADCLARARAVAEHTPADVVVSVENTSTTLISPDQFARYCRRHLCDYGRAIESAGKIHELHMCGTTRALLGRIDTIPAGSIEAFTSPTLGDTRLADGRTLAPSKALVGGTNVMVWLLPPERIADYIAEELAACPDHRRIVVTTAGVAPPACTADTFRAVGEWLKDQPVRL